MRLGRGLSFSPRRALGLTGARLRLSRRLGVPTTRYGMQRRIGAATGCLIPLLLLLTAVIAVGRTLL